MAEQLLVVKNLKKYFPIRKSSFSKKTNYVKAVDDVSFEISAGQTLGLVGESGCGKTTVGRTVLRLNTITDGEVFFKGKDIFKLSKKELRAMRPQMQIIFQDPYSSLSPRMPVGEIIGEAVRQHKICPRSQLRDYVLKIMVDCGLQPHYIDRYPHEFSGGQRQRICIARALALNPQLVICDEPVSALDVSIQAQIINLLKDLQKKYNMAYLFISHDLSVVEHISDNVGVMYLGSLVEFAVREELFKNPKHPYTKALFSAVPTPDPTMKMKRIVLQGDIPSPANPPKGCKFHTRCTHCMDICKRYIPQFKDYDGHRVACHLYDDFAKSFNSDASKVSEVERFCIAQLDKIDDIKNQIKTSRKDKLLVESLKKDLLVATNILSSTEDTLIDLENELALKINDKLVHY